MSIDEWKTADETAEDWGLTSRRVQILCKEGRLEGAVKKGHQWLIPANAKKPEKQKSGPKEKKNKAVNEDEQQAGG